MKPKTKSIVKSITIIGTLIILGLILLLKNFQDNIVFFYTPSELFTKQISQGTIIRIGGLVEKKSVTYSTDHLKVSFIVTDQEERVTVSYQGMLPNLFREGQGVVAKGRFINNIFIAEQILVKHDERYLPKEVVDKLKNSGKWRDS